VATQHSLPSRMLPLYLGRTFTGWIAPAFGWRTYSITSSASEIIGRMHGPKSR
jgi:hypothetical protein